MVASDECDYDTGAPDPATWNVYYSTGHGGDGSGLTGGMSERFDQP